MLKNIIARHLFKMVSRARSIYAVLSIKMLSAIFVINTLCAVLRSLYQQIVFEANWPVFLTDFYGYFKVLNLYGFATLLAYLALSKGPDVKMSVLRIISIGLLAFVISYPFTLFLFTWNTGHIHPTLQAGLYLFSTLLVSAWALMLVLYIKSREALPRFQMLKQQVAEESLSREKAEMELHLLQAQIEPHFFFNTLANLHSLIDTNPGNAKALLEQLSGYLRCSIPQFRRKFIQLSEELNLVKHYLNIQQMRFANRLDFEIQVDEKLEKLPVLPMSLLTLVENAIIHGIEKKAGNGKVTVSASTDSGHRLCVSIYDSAGLLTAPKFGTGLTNLVERLEVAYASMASISFCLTQNKESLVKLEFPVNG